MLELGQIEGLDRVLVLPQVGSTNDYASQVLDQRPEDWGAFNLIATDTQTRGRGRLDRIWLAPAGKNLALSFLIRPLFSTQTLPLEGYHWLGSLAALALADSLGRMGVAASLKWPNDLLIGQKKLAGILTQLLPEKEGGYALVVGLGLNVNLEAAELPVEGATSLLLATGRPHELGALAGEIASSFAAYYRAFEAAGWNPQTPLDLDGRQASLLERLESQTSTLGRRVTLHLPGGQQVQGVAEGLTPGGELELRADSGEIRAYRVGDLVHLRPAES